jgi:sirohydrochlorin cobaltochelatase
MKNGGLLKTALARGNAGFYLYPMTSPLSGAVLLGHGSREPGTLAEILALKANLAAAASGWRFAHAFLNQEPALEAAVAELAADGCARIRILPLLVFTGKHLLEDVPREIERLQALHPAVRLERAPHLYDLPGFTALITDALNASASPGNSR